MTLFGQFEKSARKFSNKKAIGFFKGEHLVFWTYQELYDKVVVVSEGLRSIGLKKGDRVAIVSQNGPEWALIDLGAARLGLVLVPIHTTLSGSQTREIIQRSGAKVLVIGSSTVLNSFYTLYDLLPGLGDSILSLVGSHLPSVKTLILYDVGAEPIPEREETYYLSELMEAGQKILQKKRLSRAAFLPSELSTIMYTSGTTGAMKGVMLTHRNLVENALSGGQATGLNSKEVLLSVLPLSHAFERTAGFFAPLFCGSTIVYGRGPSFLLEDLQIVKPTLIAAVPRLLEKVCEAIQKGIEKKSKAGSVIFQMGLSRSRIYRRLERTKNPLSNLFYLQHQVADRLFYQKIHQQLGGRLTRFISGGAPLSPDVGHFFQNIGISVLEGYGLTEASPIVTVNPPDKPKIGSVGIPLPNVRVRIGDNDEILVKGPNVMVGYEKSPEETRRAIDREGWLHTGDQGFIDREGYLYIKGRAKELIVTSYGKNVPPEPVEKQLEKSPYIKQVMIYGDARPYLVALVVPDRIAVETFAGTNGLAPLRWNQLCRHAKIKELIQKEIRQYSRPLAHHEQVQKFRLVPEEFTEHNGLLTTTLKLRRRLITDKYLREIESLYRSGG
jgi:long-chain acyl-CoA synthetase